ncbi:methyl-accepting chemotaxis protein [Catenovulum maritimum]|uniref:Chemotaxis protein n=1 Tax=Catenovulum maritimum TaxID=1513271 RepID=A0A0J8GVU8_9ALTE|nr:methyl-accepting chemotaxis protein [Catenovulum maritimum]KMT66882.1 hypothetical protein XM47_01915 [Catenovulum maritimum]
MNFINQISIKTRIIILVLIPLVVTLVLAYERYNNASDEVKNIQELEILQQYISHVSPLITALQQERLYSKLYMGPGKPDDPIGMEYKPQVLNSRGPVDKALVSYKNFIADKEKIERFPTLSKDIELVTNVIDRLELCRSLVDQRLKNALDPESDNGSKFWTYAYLNNLIARLNNSTNQVVLLASSNKELSLLANSYQNAIFAQDVVMKQILAIYAAITRGMVNNTFGDIMQYRTMEQAFIANLNNFSSPESKGFIKDNLLTIESYKFAQEEYAAIRKHINKRMDKLYPLDRIDWLKKGKDMSEGYTKVITHVLDNLSHTKDKLMEDAQTAVNNTIISLVVLLVILVLVSSKIILSINMPLKQLIDDLTKLASTKDMTIRNQIKGKNELSLVGDAFNTLIEDFEQTLSKVRQQILSMDNTTNSVADSMNKSMSLIENQKSATDNISVGINEMTATIYEVSKMSSSTSETVRLAHDLSKNSEIDAKASKLSMDELFQELGDTGTLVSNLNEEASRISNIVQVIKGISEQTNLLALNAAIEAARAGEMGRGFAVVADEVRELSKRTHDSTDQIQSQIENLISGAAEASEKMQKLQNKGLAASEKVKSSTDAFITINSELDKILDMANQIAVAADEQTNVADEINERIHNIKDESDQMSDQGRETLSSTQILLKNGSDLKDDIEVFHF